MTDDAPLQLDQMLCFALYSTAHAVQHVYKPLLVELGLTYPQYLVLVSLWHQDGQTVGMIGASLYLETNTLTPLLKRMETSGLIERSRSREDERKVILHLTEKGRAMKEHARRLSENILCKSGMTENDMFKLQRQISLLRDQLHGHT